MPTSTDLVTDLPADFAVFGQGVDTSMAELKGGTTGQVLSKTSNTDMDFTWVAQDDSNAIQNAIVDAKGDLIAASAADTPARLAVGTNGQVLTADSAEATGIKWAAASSGALTLITTGSFSAVTSKSVDNCFTSTYKNYTIILQVASDTYVANQVTFRYRGASTDGTANSYHGGYLTIAQNGTWTTHFVNPSTSAPLFRTSDTAHQSAVTGTLTVNDPLTSGYGRPIYTTGVDTSDAQTPFSGGFNYFGTITADGFTLLFSAAATGTYKIYGWSN
jgi:hypothetical protein